MSSISFGKSAHIDESVTLRIAHLVGPFAASHDLYVSCQVWADNKPLTIVSRTAHKGFSASYVWNEVLMLPIKYRDLPASAQLTVTVYDSTPAACIVGGATLRLFGKKSTLRKGKQRLQLWPGAVADGHNDSTTPSKVALSEGDSDEMGRLEKLVKRHERGDFTRLDWLDKLVFRQIEQIHASESRRSQRLFLYIDLPRFDFPVVATELEYPPHIPSSAVHVATAANVVVPPAPEQASHIVDHDFFRITDADSLRDNPIENKHLRLVRSHRNGPLDRELKPNAVTRDELNEILRYPPTHALTAYQRDLVWRHRFYLTRDKRALTKFLKSVVWSDQGEVKQAVEVLLPSWTDIEIEDALELLGPGEAFRDRRVRGYAVKQIARADDEELMLYLLQLVQALKFESAAPRHSSRHRVLQHSKSAGFATHGLEDFLIVRAVKSKVLGNHFYWYLMVEMDNPLVSKMYKKVAFQFMSRISQSPGGDQRRDEMRRQAEFVVSLSKLAKELRSSKDARPKKVEKLRLAIRDKAHLGAFPAIPLPLDASVDIVGINDERSSIFKSNLFPLRLQLRTSAAAEYPVIFKNGDDLRQDQLVIQLFTLMDRLLRKENLDLKIVAYKVLATTNVDGMVQFIPSKTLGAIASEYSTGILGFLRESHPASGAEAVFGIDKEVHDVFVRSCAGYCVLTYLLGVGDRHLDNLLISPEGHFFHVDYGYILGRDPKPFPPAIRLSKEMVEAMGGLQSSHYARFKQLCFTAFNTLRKSANLILNLIALMVDANIPDIALEPDKTLSRIQDKFRLDLGDEEAIAHLEGLLNETSSWATVLDRIHAAAQYIRA